MLILQGLIALAVTLALVDAIVGARRIRGLRTVAPAAAGPRVSVIVAARNEERGIESAVRSLLRLDYPSLEILVVNDRSTDRTGEILGRVRNADPRLTVLDVQSLPEGWLGKNHALALGARRARGEILVFTDADVIFEPSTIGRAVRALQEDRLDHLTALPDVVMKGRVLTMLVVAFGVLFALYTRPWKARDPRSRHSIGVGAFNMIRASAYRRLGTHAAIALRPDDDLQLAKAVKAHGLRQDVVRGNGFLSVEWYRTAREMIDGLMKNAFAGINYSVPALIGSTVALFMLNVWPWIALVVTTGPARMLAAIAVAALSLLVLGHTMTTRVSPVYALLYPIGVLGFIYILWRSAALALARGAIHWRDTSYPLSELRRSRAAPRLDS